MHRTSTSTTTHLAADRRFTTVDNIIWTYQIHKVISNPIGPTYKYYTKISTRSSSNMIKKSRSLKLVKNSLRTIAISDADGVHVLW